MRICHTLALCVAAAFVSAGCEVHEHDHVGVSGQVAVDGAGGAVIDAPGVSAIDVEPDPAQRVYIYDEGYPPGTYTYDGYYYYGGYRYPRDVFVNRYVQENIRQHRYVNTEENRRQGQQIEQTHRADYAKNRGVRQNRAAAPAARPQEPAHAQPKAPAPNAERPENRAPANEQRPEPVQPRANSERPENNAPANAERRAPGQQPENRANGNDEHHANGAAPNKSSAPKEAPKPNAEEPRKEEAK
ncbi:MAG TPA: hypothetical protein VG326_08580 [Tepidisphaeraceae bacterium]|jgi:hypothetical protein|nr:hypothetical protein [Tepidisphaeraceae bacterium]